MGEKHAPIITGADRLHELAEQTGHVSVPDAAAILDCSVESITLWAKAMHRENLLHYKHGIRNAYILSNTYYNTHTDVKDKVRVAFQSARKNATSGWDIRLEEQQKQLEKTAKKLEEQHALLCKYQSIVNRQATELGKAQTELNKQEASLKERRKQLKASRVEIRKLDKKLLNREQRITKIKEKHAQSKQKMQKTIRTLRTDKRALKAKLRSSQKNIKRAKKESKQYRLLLGIKKSSNWIKELPRTFL